MNNDGAYHPGQFARGRKLRSDAQEHSESPPILSTASGPQEGESVNDWFNRWRAQQHQPPVPERILGEDGEAQTTLRTFRLSDVAWHGLLALAADFGYVKGNTNNPNATKLIEAIGQGVLEVASRYGGAGLSAPLPDE